MPAAKVGTRLEQTAGKQEHALEALVVPSVLLALLAAPEVGLAPPAAPEAGLAPVALWAGRQAAPKALVAASARS